VAISLGNGKTIEARGTAYGVGSWDASPGRFQYAAVVPELRSSMSAEDFADADGAVAVGNDTAAGDTDTDRDGLTAKLERMIGSDASRLDTDGDGISDGFEVEKLRSDPSKADSDGDRQPDGVEAAMGTDPLVAAGTQPIPTPRGETVAKNDADADGDRLSDKLERLLRTDPRIPDSDGDGFVDGLEKAGGFDPTSAADNPLVGTSGSGLEATADVGGDDSATDGDHLS
jgi:hypothetical protein